MFVLYTIYYLENPLALDFMCDRFRGTRFTCVIVCVCLASVLRFSNKSTRHRMNVESLSRNSRGEGRSTP